ncbi:tripartite tricarboxylate transporter permease [Candidatus Woesearchaeota archaeon]|nr:tripartite tricarboxylate transporter permease [Candidatus Woesearchaeota archaeon]
MLFGLLVYMIAGIVAGLVFGLVPGMHNNLVSTMILALAPLLLHTVSPLSLAVLIMSMAASHLISSLIPSLFLNVPEDTAALLPLHRMVKQGEGVLALQVMILGIIAGTFMSIAFLPLFMIGVASAYPFIKPWLGYAVLTCCMVLLLQQKKKGAAALVFFLTGLLGIVVFHTPQIREPLFPLLTGLFGMSAILLGLREESALPRQKELRLCIVGKRIVKPVFCGVFSGTFMALIPGLSGASAGSVTGAWLQEKGDEVRLLMMSSIGAANTFLALGTFIALGKARNGSLVAMTTLVPELHMQELILLVGAGMIGIGATTVVILNSRKMWLKIMDIPQDILGIVLLMFLSSLVFLLEGWMGLLVLFTSMMAGLVTHEIAVPRSLMMGCILLPVMLMLLL